MTERVWTCQRVQGGEKCGRVNRRRLHLCAKCGKRRPPTRQPGHRQARDAMPYDEWVARFGSTCNLCGRAPRNGKRLQRDHDHDTGKPRGLLCHLCNRALPQWMSASWLRRAADYLERP